MALQALLLAAYACKIEYLEVRTEYYGILRSTSMEKWSIWWSGVARVAACFGRETEERVYLCAAVVGVAASVAGVAGASADIGTGSRGCIGKCNFLPYFSSYVPLD